LKIVFDDPRGPVEHFSWGKFVIFGEEHSGNGDSRKGKGKDIRIIGKKVKRWKERKGHTLDLPMVDTVIGKGVKVVVIGNGEDGALSVPEEVVKHLLGNGIETVIVKKTTEACKEYNKLYHDGESVALFAHGTC
jgi:hypothetical protein